MGCKIQKSLIRTDIKNMLLVVTVLNLQVACINDKFSKPFKSYLGEDVVYNFIKSMAEENK